MQCTQNFNISSGLISLHTDSNQNDNYENNRPSTLKVTSFNATASKRGGGVKTDEVKPNG